MLSLIVVQFGPSGMTNCISLFSSPEHCNFSFLLQCRLRSLPRTVRSGLFII